MFESTTEEKMRISNFRHTSIVHKNQISTMAMGKCEIWRTRREDWWVLWKENATVSKPTLSQFWKHCYERSRQTFLSLCLGL